MLQVAVWSCILQIERCKFHNMLQYIVAFACGTLNVAVARRMSYCVLHAACCLTKLVAHAGCMLHVACCIVAVYMLQYGSRVAYCCNCRLQYLPHIAHNGVVAWGSRCMLHFASLTLRVARRPYARAAAAAPTDGGALANARQLVQTSGPAPIPLVRPACVP